MLVIILTVYLKPLQCTCLGYGSTAHKQSQLLLHEWTPTEELNRIWAGTKQMLTLKAYRVILGSALLSKR